MVSARWAALMAFFSLNRLPLSPPSVRMTMARRPSWLPSSMLETAQIGVVEQRTAAAVGIAGDVVVRLREVGERVLERG